MRTYVITAVQMPQIFPQEWQVITDLRDLNPRLPRHVAYIDWADLILERCQVQWGYMDSGLERQIFIHPNVDPLLRGALRARVDLYNRRLHPYLRGKYFYTCDDIELY